MGMRGVSEGNYRSALSCWGIEWLLAIGKIKHKAHRKLKVAILLRFGMLNLSTKFV